MVSAWASSATPRNGGYTGEQVMTASPLFRKALATRDRATTSPPRWMMWAWFIVTLWRVVRYSVRAWLRLSCAFA